jgi:diguanylate cyclase (GGDEF)-like protein
MSKDPQDIYKKNLELLSKEDVINLLKLKDAMLDITHVILDFKDITELFETVLDKIMEVMQFGDFGSVLLLDKDNNLTIAVSSGYQDKYIHNFKIPLQESFFWNRSEGKIEKTQIINDIHYEIWDTKTRDIENSASHIIKSSISTPIIVNGHLYGLINIDSIHNMVFGDFELEILEYLRDQMEIGINNHLLYQKTVYLSTYDSLTSVYNRRHFEELFEKTLLDYQQNDKHFHVVVFDLNNLKGVNDNYGHLAGDTFINTFARAISQVLPAGDIFARLAGDEFAAIYFNTNQVEIKETMDNIKSKLINEPLLFECNRVICSYSYGIAEYPIDGTNYNQLIKDADRKMYMNKKENKQIGNLCC